jgi:putative spermidine/putrescine transport system permease protein
VSASSVTADAAAPARPARRRRAVELNRPALLVVPMVLFLGAFFAYPTYEILQRSLTEFSGTEVGGLDNYAWFFDTSINVTALWRTLITAACITALCLLIGYPYAYVMTLVGSRARAAMMGALLIAAATPFMVRNYAWLILLQDNGPVNDGLAALGIGRVELTGHVSGAAIAMAHILTPIVTLPLYATLRGIDRRLLEAASNLGARPRRAFWRVYLPLSLPGILAGALLCFVLTLGFYVTPTLIGSQRDALMSQLIVTQISQLLSWGHAGAMSVVLLVVCLVVLGIVAQLVKRNFRLPEESTEPPRTSERRQHESHRARVALYGASALIALWLIAPIFVVVPESLNGARSLAFPPESWSTRWYENFFSDPDWTHALWTTLKVAAIVTVLATVIGTAGAFGLVRGRFPGKGVVSAMTIAPIVVPFVIFGIGTYAVFLGWGLIGTTQGFVIAHTALALPFVVVPVAAGVQGLDQRLEDAAAGLGANRRRTLRRVMIPLLLPSVLTGALFAFLTSVDEIVVSLFISSATNRTLPVEMYNSITRDIDPTIAAASSMLLLLTAILLVAVAATMRRRRRYV